jgi:hypothetical protein
MATNVQRIVVVGSALWVPGGVFLICNSSSQAVNGRALLSGKKAGVI